MEIDILSVQEWEKRGIFSQTRVLETLSERMQQYIWVEKYLYLSDEKGERRRETFESIARDGVIDEGIFLTHLGMPDAGILYRCILYLSQMPFHDTADSLTFDSFYRAFVWSIPEPVTFYEESESTRTRTSADVRRALFQSLATVEKERPVDWEEARRQAERRSLDVDEWGFPRTNFDDDGDEMFHDMLFTLYATQPEVPIWMADVGVDYFRPVAKELHGNEVKLHYLMIPGEELRWLFKVLVSAQFGQKIEDEVVECMMRAFGEEGITWELFDEALAKSPFLFNSFYRMLSSFITTPEGIIECPSGRIATPARLSQLSTMLFDYIIFEDLRIYRNYTSGQINAAELEEQLINAPGAVLLFISGRMAGETAIFGAHIPNPILKRLSTDEYDALADFNRTILFELSPVHDCCRGQAQAGWTMEMDGMWFGSRNGAAMILSADMKRLNFLQNEGKGEYPSTE